MTMTAPSPAELLGLANSPAVDPDHAALLAYAASLPDLRPIPERDHNGRYKLPDPATGQPTTWTRATTLAKTLDDTFALDQWQHRMQALGFAAAPHLVDQVAAVDPDSKEGRAALNRLCADAHDLAGGNLGSAAGTAMHTVTEHADAGTLDGRPMPDTVAASLAAYQTALARAAVTVDPAWIERVIVCPDVNAAGTLDRIVTVEGHDLPYILDVKTAKDMSYSWLATSIQLATYAHASHLVELTGAGYEPMPAVHQGLALVAHMPVGAGTCVLYWLNIATGWQRALLAAEVRKTRNGTAKLAVEVAPAQPIAPAAPATPVVMPTPQPPTPAAAPQSTPTLVDASPATSQPTPAVDPADRTAWLINRFRELAANPQARTTIARHWPADVPTSPPWNDQQIDALHPILEAVEAAASAPFPPADPATPPTDTTPADPDPDSLEPRNWPDPDNGGPADPDTVNLLRAVMKDLPAARLDVAKTWLHDARTVGRPIAIPADQLTVRHAAVTAAIVACLTHLYDADDPEALTRAALDTVIDRRLDAAWTTGSILASLTVEQADLLAETAEAFASDLNVAARLGDLVAATAAPTPTTNTQNSETTP